MEHTGNEESPRPRARARVVYKPVPPREGLKKRAAEKASAAPSPYLRAENEDDDGYDPYSDRREEPPLFEPSPWD